MKRNIILLIAAAGLFALLRPAKHLGNLLFDDRRNVIPFALVGIAALAILIAVALDGVHWALKRPNTPPSRLPPQG